ncbi:hypothetical protein OC846_004851 [Tilletia horrida]|uniref:Uncharacterized protein n=1 Tax=Tilletia horrida TaxID=155126 RepID=A0AAN6JWJ2_9BASI|nr:hypothetical protein OC845_005589 [Tilletia horrida]KAK0547433.1 hypothetical protein OC846_004851 [Tilletia horrida]KAK0561899.1 hypothetical protein OC861_005595 [Tilletia horrida]
MAYPPPSGPPPFDHDGEGYPTHNPYAAAPASGAGEYAYASGQSQSRPPPNAGSGWIGGGGRVGGNRRSAAGGAFGMLVQRSPLRGVVLFTAVLSALYLAVGAYVEFRSVGKAYEPGSIKIFDIIEGALFSAAAVIEVFGVYAAVKAVYPLVRLYSLASCISYGCTLAGELLGIIVHFSHKSAIIDSCTKYNTNATVASYYSGWWSDYNDDNVPRLTNINGTMVISAADAATWCNNIYKRYTPWSILWFIASIFIGGLFVILSFAFARQLLDPAFGRSRTRVAPSSRFNNGNNATTVPELRYDSYAMGSAGGAAGRRSTDSDYAWDSRDAKSPAYDPYSYGRFEEDGTTGAQDRKRGNDGDASTLVGEEDRKEKFGADEDDLQRSSSRAGSSRGVQLSDNPV